MSDGRSSGGYIVKKQSSKKEEDIPSLNDTHTKEPIKTGKEARTNSLPDQYQREGPGLSESPKPPAAQMSFCDNNRHSIFHHLRIAVVRQPHGHDVSARHGVVLQRVHQRSPSTDGQLAHERGGGSLTLVGSHRLYAKMNLLRALVSL